jgi:translation initiation factor 2B subunit (eIF-2B alpha/beta/delta family)
VTEWKSWPSWRRLIAIARVRTSGSAAAAGSLAAGSLADLVEGVGNYAPEAYPDAIVEISDELLERQPAMAPIVGLVNTVYLGLGGGPESLAAELRRVQRRMATSAGLLAEIGAALVGEDAAVLTHGGSASVKGMLLRAAAERRISVSCATSLPEGAGIELAADLAAEGLRVEVVPDDQVPEALPGVDMVIFGAAAFGPDYSLAVTGSPSIVIEAQDLGLPVYLVASVEKALPQPLFDRAVVAAAATRQFEPVALGTLTSVVTEVGILDPLGAGKLAAERRVAPRLVGPRYAGNPPAGASATE